MSLGNPVVIREGQQDQKFQALTPITARRDDPNSFNEALLQELINDCPSVLPVREYLPSTTALFSLGREVPVNLGANQGFIDNLLVTNDGYVVIVETKLYRNPEGVREVIAQTLQYGMAIGQMSLIELEACICKGMAPALNRGESIRDCVFRQAATLRRLGALTDDFEEALERHLRRGEILLLIASDGIHVGVERVSHWLNEQSNSSPFRFGLVELRFHMHGQDRVVIPRTVLKTREVSRHVVVVDIQSGQGITANANVTDEIRTQHGGKIKESRAVKLSGPSMTKEQLLRQITPEDLAAASAVIEQLEVIGLDQVGTAHSLRFGFSYPQESGNFVPIVYLGTGDVYFQIPKSTFSLLTTDQQCTFRGKAAAMGFYRAEQIEQPNAASSNVKYKALVGLIAEFVTLIDWTRNQLTAAMRDAAGEQ